MPNEVNGKQRSLRCLCWSEESCTIESGIKTVKSGAVEIPCKTSLLGRQLIIEDLSVHMSMVRREVLGCRFLEGDKGQDASCILDNVEALLIACDRLMNCRHADQTVEVLRGLFCLLNLELSAHMCKSENLGSDLHHKIGGYR